MYTIFTIIGVIESIIFIITLSYVSYLFSRGILPALYRLGNGLGSKKIAIFAKGDSARELEQMLDNSGLFRNYLTITSESLFEDAKKAGILLVNWSDYTADINTILSLKKEEDALILYAPGGYNSVPQDIIDECNKKQNFFLVGARGRLLGDILTAMFTTKT